MSLLMLVTVFSLSACGSSSDDDNGNNNNPFPINKRLDKVTISYETGGKQTEYIYDSQGRITQLKGYYYDDNQGHITSSYVYDNNSITMTHYFSKEISWQEIYTLESGRIVKAYDGDTKVTTVFIYDNGYLTKETESKGHEFNYIWSDGNLIEVYDGNKKIQTYGYTDIVAPQGFSLWGIM